MLRLRQNPSDVLVGTRFVQGSGARGPSLAPRLHFRFRLWRNVYSVLFTTETRSPSLDVCLVPACPGRPSFPTELSPFEAGRDTRAYLPEFVRRRRRRRDCASGFPASTRSIIAAACPVPGGSVRPDPADGLRAVPARTPNPRGSTTRGGRVRRPASHPFRFRHA